jgi:peptidoglycan DL-endopeptidase CwlO
MAGAGTVALSLGLCLCAGQLVASTPAAAAAPAIQSVSVTTAKAASVAPKISASYSTRTVKWGSTFKVTAKLIDPRTSKQLISGTIRLQYYSKGKWHTTGVKGNNSKGVVSFTVKPSKSVYYRVAYSGTRGVKAGMTGKTVVNVKNSGAKVLAEAAKHKGALYKYGAVGPKRFDCSGFTKYVYKAAAGKTLPHKADSQQSYGKSVSKGSKQVGDLIVFRNGSYGYHAGIYAGGGYIYDSPHSGARVGKHKIWSSNYVVRRLA